MAGAKKRAKKPVGRDRVLFNILSYAVLTALSAACLLPFLLVLSGSVSEQYSIQLHGYRLFPETISLDAYKMRRCKNRRRLLIRPTAADEKILPGSGGGKGSAPLPFVLVGDRRAPGEKDDKTVIKEAAMKRKKRIIRMLAAFCGVVRAAGVTAGRRGRSRSSLRGRRGREPWPASAGWRHIDMSLISDAMWQANGYWMNRAFWQALVIDALGYDPWHLTGNRKRPFGDRYGAG